MELTFRLDDDDYLDFVKHARARVDAQGNIRAKLSALAWACWCIPAFAVIATAYFWAENRQASLGHWYAALVLVVAWIATWYWYWRRYSELQTAHFNSPDGFFKQEQRLRVSETGLTVVRATSSQDYQWTAIKSLCDSDRLLFLHLDTAHALCVPRRVFSSREQADGFVATVEKHGVPRC